MNILTKLIRAVYPSLKDELYISGMNKSVESFVKLAFAIGLVASLIFLLPIFYLLFLLKKPLVFVPLIFVLLWVFFTVLLLKIPSFNIRRVSSRIEGQVAVLGRRLLIQLESGKSLINAIIDLAKHEKESSKALEILAYELYMGKPLEDAINEAIHNSPSQTFKKIFIQIRNSLRTGSDLKHSLKVTLEDITKEKIVEFESFGKKLNTMGLFYMVFGTIGPSLGGVVFVMALALLKVKITMATLSVFLIFVLAIQLIFITIFTKMRPVLEI